MKPLSLDHARSRRPAILSTTTTLFRWMTPMLLMSVFFVTMAGAFSPQVGSRRRHNHHHHHHSSTTALLAIMMLDMPPPPTVLVLPQSPVVQQQHAPTMVLGQLPPGGVSLSSSTMTIIDHTPSTLLSIQEYRKPTAEEIAQKKLKYVIFCCCCWSSESFASFFLCCIIAHVLCLVHNLQLQLDLLGRRIRCPIPGHHILLWSQILGEVKRMIMNVISIATKTRRAS
jgi:hypothetical protein